MFARTIRPFPEIDCLASRKPEDLVEPVSRLISELGFDNFSYFTQATVKAQQHEPTFLTTYSDTWNQRYLTKSYYQIDPVIEESRTTQLPIIWGGSRYLKSLRSVPRQVMAEAREFGIASAVSVPIYGFDGRFGLFTVSCDCTRQKFNNLVRRRVGTVIAIGLNLQDAYTRHWGQETSCNTPKLTGGQRCCLRLVLEGKTTREIATIICRSEATVRYHTQHAIRILHASNTAHAAFLAHQAGLL